MTPARVPVLSLIALWLVLLSTAQIPLFQSLVGDPPSIYNRGDGGFSELVSIATVYRRVKVVASLDDLWQYDPSSSVLVLSGPDFLPSEREVLQALRWVERGGKLVVLDEYETPGPLLARIGVSVGPLHDGISTGECHLGSHRYPAVFNVYRRIEGGTPVCWVDGVPVAAAVTLGRGSVVVVGDSSIFINELMRSGYRQVQLLLALALLDRDTVVFYEGGRRGSVAVFSPQVLAKVPYYVGRFASYVLLGDSPVDAVRVVVAGVLILAVASPRSLEALTELQSRVSGYKYRRRKRGEPSVSLSFKSSVRIWEEWVRKLGG